MDSRAFACSKLLGLGLASLLPLLTAETIPLTVRDTRTAPTPSFQCQHCAPPIPVPPPTDPFFREAHANAGPAMSFETPFRPDEPRIPTIDPNCIPEIPEVPEPRAIGVLGGSLMMFGLLARRKTALSR